MNDTQKLKCKIETLRYYKLINENKWRKIINLCSFVVDDRTEHFGSRLNRIAGEVLELFQ